jgi:hypothetical protein
MLLKLKSIVKLNLFLGDIIKWHDSNTQNHDKKYQKLFKIGKKIQRKDEIPVKNYNMLKISSGL